MSHGFHKPRTALARLRGCVSQFWRTCRCVASFAMLPAPRRQGIAGVCRWATRNRGRCWRGAHPWRRSRLVGCAPLVRLRDWDSCGEGWCIAMHALCAQWARGLTACPQAQGSEGGSSTLLLTEWAHVRLPLLLEGGIVHAAARRIIASLRGRLLHAAAQRRYGLCPETQHPVDDVWVRLDGGAPTRAGARGSACGELVLVWGSSGTLQRLHTRPLISRRRMRRVMSSWSATAGARVHGLR